MTDPERIGELAIGTTTWISEPIRKRWRDERFRMLEEQRSFRWDHRNCSRIDCWILSEKVGFPPFSGPCGLQENLEDVTFSADSPRFPHVLTQGCGAEGI